MTRSGDQLQVRIQVQGIAAAQLMLGLGGGIGVGRVDPAFGSECPGPARVIGHVIAVRQHDALQTAQILDAPGEECTPARHINQHVAVRSHHQPAAGTKAAP